MTARPTVMFTSTAGAGLPKVKHFSFAYFRGIYIEM